MLSFNNSFRANLSEKSIYFARHEAMKMVQFSVGITAANQLFPNILSGINRTKFKNKAANLSFYYTDFTPQDC
jgi:hypothetical protein